MALEVNFYAGTRALYDAEPSLDPGGLYALIDGLGLYRGAQPIAGPCPFDINLLIEKTSEQSPIYELSGGFQSSESVQSIKEFFAAHPGNGSRPIRVRFTYTSGSPLSSISLDKVNLMMYNTIKSSLQEEPGIVGQFIAIEFKPKDTINNELIDCVIYKLVLAEPDLFQMYIKEFSISSTNIPTSKIVESINENRDAIVALSTNLNDEIDRAKNAESDLSSAISVESTRAKNAESDLNTKIEQESSRAASAESTLQKNIDTNSGKIDANTTNISKNADDISSTNIRLSDITTVVNDLSSKIEASTGDLTALIEKVNENISQIETIQTSLSNLDNRIDNIEAGGAGGPFWVNY